LLGVAFVHGGVEDDEQQEEGHEKLSAESIAVAESDMNMVGAKTSGRVLSVWNGGSEQTCTNQQLKKTASVG
jgi:hypothetical protein